ncbi:bacteriophage T4 gp5 trimerisation domain-containing protein, partial [Vibrio spartinae]
DTLVENDATTHIKHNQSTTIDNDRYSHIKVNDHHTVSGEARTKIAKSQTLMIEGELHVKAGKVWVNEAGTEIHIKAGEQVIIEAGNEITLKAGGSFVKVDPSGVSLSGAGVNLNSGGSAGSGSGFGGELPFNAKALIQEEQKHIMEFFYMDPELQPYAGTKYKAVLSDGTELTGALDEDGYAKLENVPNGVARIHYLSDEAFDDIPRESISKVVNRLDSLLGA